MNVTPNGYPHYLDPKNDIAFLKVFGNDKNTLPLIGLINAVMMLEEPTRLRRQRLITAIVLFSIPFVKFTWDVIGYHLRKIRIEESHRPSRERQLAKAQKESEQADTPNHSLPPSQKSTPPVHGQDEKQITTP